MLGFNPYAIFLNDKVAPLDKPEVRKAVYLALNRKAADAALNGLCPPLAQAFAALYSACLGRANGPRAGWLLASLAPDFVRERLRAAGDPARVRP